MTVLVVGFVHIFNKDLLGLVMFNILLLSTVVFFSRGRIIIFYVIFEVSLIPIVIIILCRGYQPERVEAAL